MIMTIPMQIEEAQKEIGIEIVQVKKEEFDLLKKKMRNNLGIVISDNSNFI